MHIGQGSLGVTILAEIDPKRSFNMARIGPRDTAPELAVRRALHRMGYRFRLHYPHLPGKPDSSSPSPQGDFSDFDGCFWHRHQACRIRLHTQNQDSKFWTAKFEANVARDHRVERQLREMGWTVKVVWECETRDPATLEASLRQVLSERHT